ncbi:uncharacterized protein N7458_000725 [Penicillium daleae]|uniref:BZIP domain-containing protein n=1 Tax=Penicillium daleae TaxID=63821 RepID=A0AAD6CJD6_9EURO|nr:uncharacterized protein N7458_000725 [Penicillium daleae]KAJ5465039.1 hypothetical protein N7458_000725 [Penicillium daleae]
MSQETLHTGPLSDDVTHSSSDERNLIDDVTPGNRVSAHRPPLRARPQSWHPYGPVEPPLEPSMARPIGVHSILNHPAQGTADLGGNMKLSRPGLSSSPRPRQGSSPAPRSGYPLVQQPLSPRSLPRSLMNPGSPSARFVGSSGRTSGQSSVSHSPRVPHEPPLGPRQQPPVSSPLPLDATLRPIASLPGTQPPTSASLHSTPSIHSRRTSAGPGPLTNSNSLEASPSTPHSTFSQFGRGSPAVTNVSIPPSAVGYGAPAPYMTVESLNRGIPVTAGPRSVPEDMAGATGMIPCVLDLKSGSSTQAEKRKANSDASRRFRNRKRNEMQLEQRLNAQQEEIQRNTETIRRQSEEIHFLALQRDHYRSERNFFRDTLDRSGTAIYSSPRPPSPRPAQSSLVPVLDTPTSGPGHSAAAGTGQSAASRVLDSARPQASWSGTGSPTSYSPAPSAGRSVPPHQGPQPLAGVSLPPFQGSWSRA